MRKVILVISIFLMLFNFNPAIGDILFYDDCEDYPAKSEWKTNGDGYYGKSFSVSNEQAKAGKNSYKYVLTVVPEGIDKHIGSVPLKPTRYFAYNKVFWIGFSIYIPSDFDFPSEGWVLGPQFHGSPDEIRVCDDWRNPNFAMYAKDHNQSFDVRVLGQKAECSLITYESAKTYDRRQTYSLTDPLKKGSWNDVVLNFKFNYSSDGFMKVWLNGKQVVNDIGINSFNDEFPPFFYIGLYGKVNTTTKVYYDEFRIGDSKSSYEEVAPKGNTVANTDTDALYSYEPDPTATAQEGQLLPPSLKVLSN